MTVKRAWLCFLLAVCTLGLGMFAAVAPAQEGDEGAGDPDRPQGLPSLPFAKYLDMREHQIAGFTGAGAKLPYNPRQRAIRKYERDRVRNGLSAEAGADYTQGGLAPLGLSSSDTSLGPTMIPPIAGVAPPPNQTTWTPLGPAPTPNGQTSPTGPVSGRITALAVDPAQANTVYAGTAQGGVYRSKDGGLTWTPIFDQAQSLAIGALALAPSDPSILYVGTGEGNLSADSFAGVGLYRVDNADTTADLAGPIDPLVTINYISGGPQQVGAFGGRGIGAIAVKPDDPATVFVGTTSGVIGRGGDSPRGGTLPPLPPRGVFRSTNATAAPGSVSFQKLTVTTANSADTPGTGNTNVTSMMFEPSTNDHLVVGMYGGTAGGGIWRSTDATVASPAFTQSLDLSGSSGRVALDGTRTGGVTTMIAGTGEGNGRVRESTDGGATWSTIVATPAFCGGQCFYDVAVGIRPDDADTMLAGGAGPGTIIKRTTTGSSFVSSEAGLHADTHAIAFAPSSPAVVYTGNDGGVWRSSDGGATWVNRNTAGLSATQFQSLAVLANDPVVTLGGTQDNGTQLQETTSGDWRRADYGDGGFALIDQNGTSAADATMYHTYFNADRQPHRLRASDWQRERVRRQLDGVRLRRGLPNGISCSDSVEFYAPMALGPGSPNSLYFGTNKLYRSTDRGTTMSVASQTFGSKVTAIGIAPTNDNARLVGLRNGQVFLTTSGSSPMTDVTGPWPAAFVARTVIDPNDANVAYVTVNGYSGGTAASNPAKSHVWRTSNLLSGTPTWTSAGNGLPDTPVNAFAVDPVVPGRVFAGTDVGVYRSNDSGANWVPLGSGLPVVGVFDMVVAPASSSAEVLRVATHGRGMWELAVAPSPRIPRSPPGRPPPTTPLRRSNSRPPLPARRSSVAWTAPRSPPAARRSSTRTSPREATRSEFAQLTAAAWSIPLPRRAPSPLDTTAPDTTITSGPANGSTITTSSTSYGFTSSEAGSTFECRLDGGPFAACSSAKQLTGLANGSHAFLVRAGDAVGNFDATPAIRTFTVAVPPPTDDCTPAKAAAAAAKAKVKKAKAKVKKAKKKVKKATSASATKKAKKKLKKAKAALKKAKAALKKANAAVAAAC